MKAKSILFSAIPIFIFVIVIIGICIGIYTPKEKRSLYPECEIVIIPANYYLDVLFPETDIYDDTVQKFIDKSISQTKSYKLLGVEYELKYVHTATTKFETVHVYEIQNIPLEENAEIPQIKFYADNDTLAYAGKYLFGSVGAQLGIENISELTENELYKCMQKMLGNVYQFDSQLTKYSSQVYSSSSNSGEFCAYREINGFRYYELCVQFFDGIITRINIQNNGKSKLDTYMLQSEKSAVITKTFTRECFTYNLEKFIKSLHLDDAYVYRHHDFDDLYLVTVDGVPAIKTCVGYTYSYKGSTAVAKISWNAYMLLDSASVQ